MRKWFFLAAILLLGWWVLAHWRAMGWPAGQRSQADSLLRTLAPVLDQVMPPSQYPTAEILAIIYPEMLRYSPLQDGVEQEVNRRLYARHNLTEEVDFSTGWFQMKPSFAERLEWYYRAVLPQHPCALDFVYTETDSVTRRLARLARLADPRWQLVYLRGFYHVVNHRFPQLATYPALKRVRLMALAYNVGFQRPEDSLWRWEKVKHFPHGSMAKLMGELNTHSYADLAEEFYMRTCDLTTSVPPQTRAPAPLLKTGGCSSASTTD
jgi:hypothetical protein